jgi:hypothetical protein
MDQALRRDTDDISFEENSELNENEVKDLIESVKETQYFDASSMAPLTPTSVVRTP